MVFAFYSLQVESLVFDLGSTMNLDPRLFYVLASCLTLFTDPYLKNATTIFLCIGLFQKWSLDQNQVRYKHKKFKQIKDPNFPAI